MMEQKRRFIKSSWRSLQKLLLPIFQFQGWRRGDNKIGKDFQGR